jgi:hypothetical protein
MKKGLRLTYLDLLSRINYPITGDIVVMATRNFFILYQCISQTET